MRFTFCASTRIARSSLRILTDFQQRCTMMHAMCSLASSCASSSRYSAMLRNTFVEPMHIGDRPVSASGASASPSAAPSPFRMLRARP